MAVFDGSYGSGSNPASPVPPGWLSSDSSGGPYTAPDGPITLHLRLVTIGAEATFPAPAGNFMGWLNPPKNAAGTPEPAAQLARLSDGSIQNMSRRRADTIYVITLEPANADATTDAGSPTP
jgi:hypothetical protein